MDDSGVLTCAEMGCPRDPAWEEEIVGAQMSALNPGFDAFTSRLRDLELHWTLRLALRDHGTTLRGVMNDESVPMALRIEAAKGLLGHAAKRA